jgi:hypothetical protein
MAHAQALRGYYLGESGESIYVGARNRILVVRRPSEPIAIEHPISGDEEQIASLGEELGLSDEVSATAVYLSVLLLIGSGTWIIIRERRRESASRATESASATRGGRPSTADEPPDGEGM